MCEIQFVKSFKGNLKKEDFNSFLNLMEHGSYYNADAWGICNDEKIIKNKGGFYDYKNQKKLYNKLCNNKSFLIGHNRYATKGDKEDNSNNHPFESKDFMLVHNGVITNDDMLKQLKELFYSGETDSIVILELIQALSDKGFEIVKAIKKTAELLDGSFSVLLYDKRNGKNYYFKNSKTKFSFALVTRNNKKILFGSTDKINFNYIYTTYDMIFDTIDVDSIITKDAESGVIYEIDNELIKSVSTFTEKKIKETNYYYDGNNVATNTNIHYANDNIELYNNAKKVQEILSGEGIYTTMSVDYKNMEAKFKPTRQLTEREETEVYLILNNNTFFDGDTGSFVMTLDEIDTFLYYDHATWKMDKGIESRF